MRVRWERAPRELRAEEIAEFALLAVLLALCAAAGVPVLTRALFRISVSLWAWF